jgi:ribosomal protein L16 Arg81 hydroxylase
MLPLPGFLDRDALPAGAVLWLEGGGAASPLHREAVNLLLVQLHGERTLTLISPEQTPLLAAADGGAGTVDPDAPDLERYPRFRDAHAFAFTLGPGDALFLPVAWWHQIRAADRSVALALTNFAAPNEFALK